VRRGGCERVKAAQARAGHRAPGGKRAAGLHRALVGWLMLGAPGLGCQGPVRCAAHVYTASGSLAAARTRTYVCASSTPSTRRFATAEMLLLRHHVGAAGAAGAAWDN
jgi:hypothetical protein